MKNVHLYKIIVLLTCLASFHFADADNSPEKSAIQVFLQSCAATYAHESEVEKVARELGMVEVPADEKGEYLKGNPGSVWRGSDSSMPYAVAVQPNGLCTVFVFAGDAKEIQKDVEWWLPPESTGIKVTKEELSSSHDLKTTAYELRGGKVRERWVITISSNPSSELRALLSWNRL
jgi:hypothetical protein